MLQPSILKMRCSKAGFGLSLTVLSTLCASSFQQAGPQVDLGYEIHEGVYNVSLTGGLVSLTDFSRLRRICTSLATFDTRSRRLANCDSQRQSLLMARAATLSLETSLQCVHRDILHGTFSSLWYIATGGRPATSLYSTTRELRHNSMHS